MQKIQLLKDFQHYMRNKGNINIFNILNNSNKKAIKLLSKKRELTCIKSYFN